nr:MAG TPA: hypothetical protein [Caudoviricetes sp.]
MHKYYLYNISKVAGCFLRLHTRNKLKAYLKLFLHENTFAARISLYLQQGKLFEL